jgi:AcrR family transcriptional regulator
MTKGMLTKKKIYETARSLFEEFGVDQISVDHIVQKAGVSKGTFYIHYPSKWSLLAEYLGSLDVNYEEYFNSIREDTSAAAMIDLVTRKTALILVNEIGYNFLRHSYAAMLLGELNSEDILNYSRKLPVIYKNVISKGVSTGEFRSSTDADHWTREIMGTIRGTTFEWCVSACGFNLEEELIKHIQLLTKELKTNEH